MFGIGMTELLVILVVALVVFGPKRLPELAKSLGRAMGEFRRASTDLRRTLNEAVEEPRIEPPRVAGEPVNATQDADASAAKDAPAAEPADASGAPAPPAAGPGVEDPDRG